jgi:hypothetical protein
MFPKSILIALVVLALVSMACGVNIDLPAVDEIQVGPEVTEDINVTQPGAAGDVAKLTLDFGAGELFIAPGSQSALVEGTATFNVDDLRPEVTVEGNDVRIETGDWEINSIPKLSDDFKNEWNLKLGNVPMDLGSTRAPTRASSIWAAWQSSPCSSATAPLTCAWNSLYLTWWRWKRCAIPPARLTWSYLDWQTLISMT